MVISQLSSKNMLLQLCVGALRVAFERREPSNSSMERGHVLGPRQIMLFVENLQAFNFHLAQALIHAPTQESSANGWSSAVPVVVLIDTAAVAKRVHPRTRPVLWTATQAFGEFMLGCCTGGLALVRRQGCCLLGHDGGRPSDDGPGDGT